MNRSLQVWRWLVQPIGLIGIAFYIIMNAFLTWFLFYQGVSTIFTLLVMGFFLTFPVGAIALRSGWHRIEKLMVALMALQAGIIGTWLYFHWYGY